MSRDGRNPTRMAGGLSSGALVAYSLPNAAILAARPDAIRVPAGYLAASGSALNAVLCPKLCSEIRASGLPAAPGNVNAPRLRRTRRVGLSGPDELNRLKPVIHCGENLGGGKPAFLCGRIAGPASPHHQYASNQPHTLNGAQRSRHSKSRNSAYLLVDSPAAAPYS